MTFDGYRDILQRINCIRLNDAQLADTISALLVAIMDLDDKFPKSIRENT